MNKETKSKLGLFLGITIITLGTTAIGLIIYGLCDTYFNLYRMGMKEEITTMLVGVISTGAIALLIHMILLAWKELTT